MHEVEVIAGQPSYRVESDRVAAYVTRMGGHLGPATFRLPHGDVQPLHVSPWAEDPPRGEPNILQILRGDFFCMPFGGSPSEFRGERHPVHGETANGEWHVESMGQGFIELAIDTHVRSGHVRKRIELRAGETAVYSRHRVEGMAGPMTYGHHAMLRFRSPGLVSTTPFAYGRVFPEPFEDPAAGGYTSLQQGARFDCLERVPMADGGVADLSQYPAREGFEDLVMILPPSGTEIGWTAVVFPQDGYLWLSLKDPTVLPATVLWHSNGGRHYAPWNGRHRGVLGIEEVCSWFHAGLGPSVADNDVNRLGFATYRELSPDRPLEVSTIQLVLPIPPGFDHVGRVEPTDRGVHIVARSGHELDSPVDIGWLKSDGTDE